MSFLDELKRLARPYEDEDDDEEGEDDNEPIFTDIGSQEKPALPEKKAGKQKIIR